MDPIIRFYVIDSDGALEPFASMPLSDYGTCPNVGDTMCVERGGRRPDFYSVQRRYFVDDIGFPSGWAVVLREFDTSPQTVAVMKAWREDNAWEKKINEQEAAERQRADALNWEQLKLRIGRIPSEFNLNLREENAIQKLSDQGIGARMPCRAFQDFGEGTRKSLLKRGFISLHPGSSGKFGDDEIALTASGDEALKNLKAHRKKVARARKENDNI